MTPSSQSVEVTHTSMFTTTVSGVGVENFKYQWRRNETIITGETGDTLMITNVMEGDSGNYECIVTNQYGDVATAAANLTAYGKNFTILVFVCFCTYHINHAIWCVK